MLRICTHCAASTKKSPTFTDKRFIWCELRNFIVTSTELDETPEKMELRYYNRTSCCICLQNKSGSMLCYSRFLEYTGVVQMIGEEQNDLQGRYEN